MCDYKLTSLNTRKYIKFSFGLKKTTVRVIEAAKVKFLSGVKVCARIDTTNRVVVRKERNMCLATIQFPNLL